MLSVWSKIVLSVWSNMLETKCHFIWLLWSIETFAKDDVIWFSDVIYGASIWNMQIIGDLMFFKAGLFI